MDKNTVLFKFELTAGYIMERLQDNQVEPTPENVQKVANKLNEANAFTRVVGDQTFNTLGEDAVEPQIYESIDDICKEIQ